MKRIPKLLPVLAIIAIPALFTQLSWAIESTEYGKALDQTDLVFTATGDVSPVAQSEISYDGEDAIRFGPSLYDPQKPYHLRDGVTTTVHGPARISWITKGPIESPSIEYSGWSQYHRPLIETALDDNWIKHETILDNDLYYELRWTIGSLSEGESGDIISYLDQLSVDYGPLIRIQPAQALSQIGDSATLRVKLYDNSPPATYQWRAAGEPIEGATSPTFEIPSVAENQYDVPFDVVISNEYGQTVSDSVYIKPKNVISEALGTSSIEYDFEYWNLEEDSEYANGKALVASGKDWSKGSLTTTVQGPIKILYHSSTGYFQVSLYATRLGEDHPFAFAQEADLNGTRTLNIQEEGTFELEWVAEGEPGYIGPISIGLYYAFLRSADLVSVYIDDIEFIYPLNSEQENKRIVQWTKEDYVIEPNIPLDGPSTYQWYYTDNYNSSLTPILGETGPTLSSLVEPGRNGPYYQLIVTQNDIRYQSEVIRFQRAFVDSDFDGTVDIIEEVIGTDPYDILSNITFTRRTRTEVIPENGNAQLETVTYWVLNKNVPSSSDTFCDCRLVVEGSYDLVEWIELPLSWPQGATFKGYRDPSRFNDLDQSIPFVRVKLTEESP